MAKTVYTVTPKSGVNSYGSPQGYAATKVKHYKKGKELKIEKQQNGMGKINGKGEWVSMKYLKKNGNTSKSTSKKSSKEKEKDNIGNAKEIKDAPPSTDGIYGHNSDSYDKLLLKYIYTFGSPPKYTEAVDPYYDTKKKGIYVGRAMASTWFSDPAILSLCPGKVDYLPGFSRKNKDEFFKSIKGKLENAGVIDLAKKDKKKDMNGALYSFRPAYAEYMNVVNNLARISADLMGIGNVKNLMHGTSAALNSMDYGYYTNPENPNSTGRGSIFAETKRAISSAVSDSQYVHFFINHNGANISEGISTEAGKSWLEQKLDDESGISSAAQNIEFLFGGAISTDARKDIDKLLDNVSDSSQLLGGFTRIASNYLQGGRLVFPKMITGMNYEKSIEVELQFTSIYGDKESIFKYTILPALHIIAMATPKQMSSNMYTYPFLVRAYQKGNCNCDLGFISNLSITRGGADDTSWTVDGLPTEIGVRFTITPLYSNLMVSSSRNPFLTMQNTSLLEYLGVMCGIDMKANNLAKKKEIATKLLQNYVFDTPTSAARGIGGMKFINEISKFTQIISK